LHPLWKYTCCELGEEAFKIVALEISIIDGSNRMRRRSGSIVFRRKRKESANVWMTLYIYPT
jgi:hypothetical protein